MTTFKKIGWTGTAKAELKSGDADADTLDGQGGADTLKGLGGGDDLYGGNGGDVIYGGSGGDFIGGDKGADRLFGGTGEDRIYISGMDTATGGAGPDEFVLLDPGNGGGDKSDLGVVRIEDFETAGTGHDLLDLGVFGFFSGVRWQHRDKGLEDNFEMFRDGDDTILRLKGETGTVVKVILNDVLPGQLTEDHFFFTAAMQISRSEPPHSMVNWNGTAKAESKSGSAQADSMDGKGGNDTLKGLDGDDNLRGGKGADVVFGGAGDDRLYISGGDTVTGGSGADTFVLWDYGMQPSVSDAGVARVQDFKTDGVKHDKVDLTMFSGLNWAERDKGLEDGMEILAKGGDTLIRIKGTDGVVSAMLLVGVAKADLTDSHFDWPLF